jgi:hypothetical protein
MKRIIVMVISMAFLFSAPFASARGGASIRANLDRIWKQEQAQQQRIDRNLDRIQKDAERGRSQMYKDSGPSTTDSGRGNP